MRSFLILCLVSLALGGAIPGQEKCVWGPSYWCSHVQHARECGATKHCLQTVWKNQILKPESTKTCTYCELIVGEVRNALKDKATEADIANLLTNVCAILPNPDDRDLCKGVITEYAPELLQMFVEDISTDTVCATLGFCSGLEDTHSPYGVKLNDDCTDCTKFFKDVQESITSNETVNQLTQLINQTICSQLGGFSNTCLDLVKSVLPQLLQTLADELDPSLTCRIFGFCNTDGKQINVIKIDNIFHGKTSTESLRYRSDEECDICKELFNQIVSVIRDKDNQDKIIAEAKNVVCDELGSLADQCKEFIDQYAPMLFELLVNELDPTTVCEAVGLCPTPSLYDSMVVSHYKPSVMVGPGYLKSSVECTICKTVMQELDNVLQENVTITTIEDLIDKVCDRLSSDLKKQCRAFVAEYGPLVIKETAQFLNPIKICDLIKLCKNGSMTVEAKADTLCVLCEKIIEVLENAVQNISTDDIMKLLKDVCADVPPTYTKTCLTYVNEYAAIVINLLKEKMDPHQICLLGKLCTSSQTTGNKILETKPIPELIPKAGPSTECEVCDTVIVYVKTMLSDNATEQEVEDLLKEVCTVFPSETFQQACAMLISQYGKEIIDYLVKDMDAHAICTELGLCQALSKPLSQAVSVVMSPYDTLPLVTPEDVKGGPSMECKVCNTIIVYAKTFLSNNASEEEVKQLLDDICSKIPSALKTACTDFIDTYGKKLIDLLVKDLDAHTICTDLDLCKALKKPLSQVASVIMSPYDTLPLITPEKDVKGEEGSDLECTACTTLLTYVENELQENSTEVEIKNALEEACTKLPEFAQQCQELVDTYLQVIINYILLDVDPPVICKDIGLCPSETKKLPKPLEVKVLKSNTDVKATNVVTCAVCKVAMKFLDKILQENRTEAAVKEALDKLCSYLPSSMSSECQNLVDTYSDQIIHLLVDEMIDPSKVCSAIGLCPRAQQPLIKDVKATNVVTCAVCKAAMEYLDKVLQENRTEAAVKEALDKMCSYLPSSMSSECQNLVDTYSDQIIHLLVDEMIDPSKVCSAIGLCPRAQQPLIKEPENVKDGPFCVICEFVLSQLDIILEGNRSEVAIEAALEKVCSLMPDTVSTECVQFVNTYSRQIIDLLVKTVFNPSEICLKIKACKTPMSQPYGAFVKILPEKEKGDLDYCETCEFIVGDIQTYLKENKTEDEIIQLVKQLCHYLPDTVSVQCEQEAEVYMKRIIDMISQGLTPQQICVAIGICAGTENTSNDKEDNTLFFKPHHKLVGGSKCTYGPAYWCASKENAQECNAIEHCMNHVWN
ncbi:hypothetical protein ACF0H5_000951 [Mactra antiquata]